MQAPHSRLQPRYHPLQASCHPLPPLASPHSSPSPRQLHALAGGGDTDSNLNQSRRRSSITIGAGHGDLFGSHTNVFGAPSLGGDNQLAPSRAGRRLSCGLPGLSLFQVSTSVEPARRRGLSAVAYAAPGSPGLAELPGLPEDSMAPSKLGRVGIRRGTAAAGNGPPASGSAAPEPSAVVKKPVKKPVVGGASSRVAGSMKSLDRQLKNLQTTQTETADALAEEKRVSKAERRRSEVRETWRRAGLGAAGMQAEMSSRSVDSEDLAGGDETEVSEEGVPQPQP